MKDVMFYATLFGVAFLFFNLGCRYGWYKFRREVKKAALHSGLVDLGDRRLYSVQRTFSDN